MDDEQIHQPLDEMIITSDYGVDRTEGTSPHTGIDYRAKSPVPVYIPGKGIIFSNPNSEYNTSTFRFTHGSFENFVVQFLHLSSRSVAPGSSKAVKGGDVLGKTGSKGAATPHLHVQAFNAKGVRINPSVIYGKK